MPSELKRTGKYISGKEANITGLYDLVNNLKFDISPIQMKFISGFLLCFFILCFSFVKAQITVTLQASEDAAIGFHDGTSSNANNYGGATQNAAFIIPASANPNGQNGNRALIKFNLNVLPPTASILSASINLYALGPTGILPGHVGNANPCYLKRSTQNWGEYTVTWNNQPTSIALNQVTLAQSNNALQDYLNQDVTLLVQDMWNNMAGSHGFLLRLVQENVSNGLLFGSRNHADPLKRPTLVIVYNACSTPTLSINTPSICAGQSTILQVTAAANLSYTWLPGGSNNSTLSITPSATSVYTVLAEDGNGCGTEKTASVTVSPITTPLVSFNYGGPFCANSENVNPALTNGFRQGGFYSSQPGLALDNVSGNVDIVGSQPGSYLVSYSVSALQCMQAASHTTQIEILQLPHLTLPSSLLIEPGGSIILPAGGTFDFSWTPSQWLSCSDCAQPLASPPVSTQFCVMSTNKTCTNTACVDLVVSCEGPFDRSVPNAFSPNGDDVNDEFCLQGWSFCTKSFEALIYNRWGELVFESNDPAFCWNGKYKGQGLPADVYVYSFKTFLKDGTEKKKKGNITLIR